MEETEPFCNDPTIAYSIRDLETGKKESLLKDKFCKVSDSMSWEFVGEDFRKANANRTFAFLRVKGSSRLSSERKTEIIKHCDDDSSTDSTETTGWSAYTKIRRSTKTQYRFCGIIKPDNAKVLEEEIEAD